jgi:hypothetical protein
MLKGRRTQSGDGERRITCARPECANEAAARLVIDVGRCVVVMDLHVGEVGGAASLCSFHADKVIPPRDWTIDDQREMTPRLFPVAKPLAADSVFDAEVDGGQNDDGSPKRTRRRRRKSDDEAVAENDSPRGQLSFDETPYNLPEEYVEVALLDADLLDDVIENPVENPVEFIGHDVDREPEEASPEADVSPLLARAFEQSRATRTPSHLADIRNEPNE